MPNEPEVRSPAGEQPEVMTDAGRPAGGGTEVAAQAGKPAPGQPEVITDTANPAAAGPKVITDVEGLAKGLRETLETLIVNGATIEIATAALNLRLAPKQIVPEAIETWVFLNPAIQEKRITHSVDAARVFRKALGKAQGDDIEIADAVILAGLSGLHAAQNNLKTDEALRRHFERVEASYKRHDRNESTEHALRMDILRRRSRMLQLQARWVAERIYAIERNVHKMSAHDPAGDKQLTAETLQKIREIYGLVVEQPPETENPEAPQPETARP